MSLSEVVNNNDVAALEAFVANKSIDINVVVRETAALTMAARKNSSEMVKILLEAKADPNIQDWFVPPQCSAAAKGHDTILQILIEHNANVNIKTHREETPLFVASMNGRVSCANILLRAGADPNMASTNECVPLYETRYSDNGKVIAKLLMEASADINLLPKDRYIPKWLDDMFDQRRHAKRALITFLGVMKYRFRLECQATQIIGYRYPRDMTRKISGEIWDTRFNDKWHPRVMKRVKVCDHKCKNKEMCGHLCCKK